MHREAVAGRPILDCDARFGESHLLCADLMKRAPNVVSTRLHKQAVALYEVVLRQLPVERAAGHHRKFGALPRRRGVRLRRTIWPSQQPLDGRGHQPSDRIGIAISRGQRLESVE